MNKENLAIRGKVMAVLDDLTKISRVLRLVNSSTYFVPQDTEAKVQESPLHYYRRVNEALIDVRLVNRDARVKIDDIYNELLSLLGEIKELNK